MDETTVCLTESRMTNISDINTGPEQSVCECYVYFMCIYNSVARLSSYYLNSAKFVSKVRSVLGFFFFHMPNSFRFDKLVKNSVSNLPCWRAW